MSFQWSLLLRDVRLPCASESDRRARTEALVAVYQVAFEKDGPPAEETIAIGKGEANQSLALGTTKSIGLRVGHSFFEYIIEAMDLSALYTHGTKLAEVSPEFRGMPLNEWLHKWELQQVTVQAAEYDRRFRNSMPAGYVPPLSRKAVSTQRDDYGMKGVR